MNEINETAVLEWLARQPDDRQFDYFEGNPEDATGCLLCNYLREAGEMKFGIGGSTYNLNARRDLLIPKLLRAIADGVADQVFTAGEAKRVLAELQKVSV